MALVCDQNVVVAVADAASELTFMEPGLRDAHVDSKQCGHVLGERDERLEI